MQILLGRIRRLAETGWLRVDESLAAALIHATARGAVLTWLSLPEERRDPALLTRDAGIDGDGRHHSDARCGGRRPGRSRSGASRPPSPSKLRSARASRRCSLFGSTGLPALRAPSRTAHVDLREVRLGSGAGYAP